MELAIFLLLTAGGLSASELSDEVFWESFEASDLDILEARCVIDINRDLRTPQPLFIRPGTEQFHHPTNRSGVMEFNEGQEMELYCSNGFATPSGMTRNLAVVACSGATRFRYDGKFYNLNEFTCRNWPAYIAQRRATPERCFNSGIFIDVGFRVENRFVKVFTACHDTISEQNYYTIYQFTPVSDGNARSVTRPSWNQGEFFPGKNVDNLYTRVNQQITIAEILGSYELAAKYIEAAPSNVFLARGHIAAMTDFISANEQRSTFFFNNAAPQWQTFNSLNWAAVELSSRRLAADRNINLNVYLGTFGITSIKNGSGVNREIFIDGRNGNHQIPVPMIFYKILVNPVDHSGIVLIGVNNHHLMLAEVLADYVICNDVADRINYVTWQRKTLTRGYGYACEVNDFLNRVPHIPGIIVNSLLL